MNRTEVKQGERIPELDRDGLYLVSARGIIIISNVPGHDIGVRLVTSRFSHHGEFRAVYDNEKGALEGLELEGPYEKNTKTIEDYMGERKA